jgi:hypothetical protein
MAKQKKAAVSVNASSDAPAGVKVISVLYYIGAVLFVLFALLFFIGASFLGGVLAGVPFLASLGAGFFAIVGIIFLAFAVLGFFVGMGLWKLQSWARIVAIIFAIIGFVMGISDLVSGAPGSGVFSIIVNGLIGWYLLFNQEAKSAFK